MGSARLVVERLLPIAILVFAIFSVPLMIFSPSGLGRLNNLQAEKARADDEVARLSREIEQLRAKVRLIKQDPAAVERAARDELGLLRQTEVVFQFKQ